MSRVAVERAECEGRPSIFVAHSLGGILVKDALNESSQAKSRRDHLDISRSCRAIVFMGTPHLGSSLASWGRVLANVIGTLPGGFSTYDKVLRGLEPDSEVLDRISRQFEDILDEKTIQICSVQEGQGVTSVKGGDRKVCLTTVLIQIRFLTNRQVVPDFSSVFNRRGIEEIFVNEAANHMDMCKFAAANDATYKDVSRFLQRCCRKFKETQTEQERLDQAGES